MVPITDWPCWKIMNCKDPEGCPVAQEADIPCWEVASKLNDYRSVLNVCKDCIVYVSRQKQSLLSEEEIRKITESKQDCVLLQRCGS